VPAPSLDAVRSQFPDALEARGEVTVVVARDDLHRALGTLRDDSELAFDVLADITASDWPDREPRMWLAYELYSMRKKHRVRVKVGLAENDLVAPSIVSLWPGADWFEREVFDMFGVEFDGHPDLRRIIMPDDWSGHPLRKDYSLGGVDTMYKGGAFIPPVDERSP
jgi:NADH-quinone oxidoreductase subunit C